MNTSTNSINYNLPIISIDMIKAKYELTQDDERIINSILYDPVGGVGVLRATRPKNSGASAWVWRTLMTLVSQEDKFHHIATSLSSYLDEEYPNDEEETRETRVLSLELLVEKIMSSIPENEQHGANEWKRACG